MIGILDWDLLSTKKFCNYNFGVLLVSSYYLEQGIKCRLILDISYDNLKKYNKIFVFKDYKTKSVPLNFIPKYLFLPIEEYGEGFPNRPQFPDLPKIIYTKINTYIYKPLLYYISEGGKNFILDKDWKKDFFPSKLFFEQDGELLLREEGIHKKMYIYDNPLLFFNSDVGIEKMTEIKKSSIIKFVKPICISKIEPKYWAWLFNNKTIRGFKNSLYGIEDDPYWMEFYEWIQNHHTPGNIKITIKTKTGKVETLKKQGGKIYGNYRFERNDKGAVNNSFTEKNIPIGYEWVTTKRYNEGNQRSRERISETKRSKYLPSEYAKRRKQARWKYNAIRSGRF